MKNIKIQKGSAAKAVSAKQTTTSTRRQPSWKRIRLSGIYTRVTPAEYEKLMAPARKKAEGLKLIKKFEKTLKRRCDYHGKGCHETDKCRDVATQLQAYYGEFPELKNMAEQLASDWNNVAIDEAIGEISAAPSSFDATSTDSF